MSKYNYDMDYEIKKIADDIVKSIKKYRLDDTNDVNNIIDSIDGFIYDEYDDEVMYYSNCLKILENSGCYNDWDKFDVIPTSLTELAWNILNSETYDYIYNELVEYINNNYDDNGDIDD